MDLSERSDSPYRHPWELSRTEIILGELKKLKIHGKILDIGCGDRYFDKKLLEKASAITELWGIDINAEEDFHKGKEHYVNSYDAVTGKFDYILLMDVLEHIEDDISFMCRLKRYLHSESVVFVTVPAFEWLFSKHDEELHHYRRYNFKELNMVLMKSGYRAVDCSYFYLSLILMRLITRNKTQNLGMWNRAEQDIITQTIKICLNIDYIVLRILSKTGIRIGGLSLLAVCRQNMQYSSDV